MRKGCQFHIDFKLCFKCTNSVSNLHAHMLTVVYTMELVQSDTWIFRHPMTHVKYLWPKEFLLTNIKPEYFNILYNPTHFPGLLICRIRQVPLYFQLCAGFYVMFLYVNLIINNDFNWFSSSEIFIILLKHHKASWTKTIDYLWKIFLILFLQLSNMSPI
jgi:hypothetical protein